MHFKPGPIINCIAGVKWSVQDYERVDADVWYCAEEVYGILFYFCDQIEMLGEGCTLNGMTIDSSLVPTHSVRGMNPIKLETGGAQPQRELHGTSFKSRKLKL